MQRFLGRSRSFMMPLSSSFLCSFLSSLLCIFSPVAICSIHTGLKAFIHLFVSLSFLCSEMWAADGILQFLCPSGAKQVFFLIDYFYFMHTDQPQQVLELKASDNRGLCLAKLFIEIIFKTLSHFTREELKLFNSPEKIDIIISWMDGGLFLLYVHFQQIQIHPTPIP